MNQVRLKAEVTVGRTSPRRRAGRDIWRGDDRLRRAPQPGM